MVIVTELSCCLQIEERNSYGLKVSHGCFQKDRVQCTHTLYVHKLKILFRQLVKKENEPMHSSRLWNERSDETVNIGTALLPKCQHPKSYEQNVFNIEGTSVWNSASVRSLYSLLTVSDMCFQYLTSLFAATIFIHPSDSPPWIISCWNVRVQPVKHGLLWLRKRKCLNRH